VPNARTLQVRNLRFDMVVPAGTAQATPLLTLWNLGKVVVDKISVRVPPGPSGLAGLAIHYAGVPIVPSDQPGVFFVGDDQEWDWEIGWEISGPFTLVTYNTDIYPHTFYMAAQVRDITLVAAGAAEAGATIVTSIGPPAGPSAEELSGAVAEPPPEGPAGTETPAAPPPAAPTIVVPTADTTGKYVATTTERKAIIP
jgi:hypothetical protein